MKKLIPLLFLATTANADYCQFINSEDSHGFQCLETKLYDRRPTSITFVYDGDWNGQSSTRLYSYSYTYNPIPVRAYIEAFNGSDIVFEGIVSIGNEFTVPLADFRQRLEISVYDENGDYVQWITLDPRRPRVGDEVGALAVWDE